MAHSTDTTDYYTVSEYALLIGKSKQSIYNKINRGTIETVLFKDVKYLSIPKNSTSKMKETIEDIEQQNQLNKPPLNETTETPFNDMKDTEIKSLKKETKKLKKLITSKDDEIKILLERIITLEKDQKNEIIKQQDKKHQELKMYMDFIQKQTENVLPSTPNSEPKKYNEIDDDVIDADIDKKKSKKKKHTKKDKKKRK